MKVKGNSMSGALMDGDTVLLKLEGKIKTGDIFAYNYLDNNIIHRALFVGFRYVWEIGDNNYRIKRVRKDRIVAKVVANITQNKSLDFPILNYKIARINLLRCFLGKRITNTRSLIKNKFIYKSIVALTKYRNRLQQQYRYME